MDNQPPNRTYGYGADFNTRNQLYKLRIPIDAPWVRLQSNVFVQAHETVTVTVDGAVRQTFEWAPDPEERKAWHGHAFEVIGVKLEYPPFSFTFAPARGPLWPLTSADGNIIYVEIWLYRVLVGGTHLSVDLCLGQGQWPSSYGGSIQGLHFSRTMAAAIQAAKATALVWQLEKAHGGGPRRLEDRDDAEWFTLAAEAVELRRKRWTWLAIISHQRTADYENDRYWGDDKGAQKAERAAIERTKYFINRLKTIREVP